VNERYPWSDTALIRSAVISRRALVRGALPVSLVMLATGCGSSSGSTPETDVTPTSENSAAVTGPPVLGPVVWTTAIAPDSNEPTAPVAQFTVDVQTIYAVFPVERLAANTPIRAIWSLNGEAIDGVGAELTTPRDQIGGYLEFHLERTTDEVWPDGEYGVALTTAGVLIATGSVQVVRPGQNSSS
jgi:hypothetical protein